MKRSLLIAYLLLLHAALLVLIARWPEPPSHVERMQAIHSFVDQTVPDGAAVFLGDSHTQRLAVAAVADRAVNFGISWQTAEQLQVPASASRARIVFLLIGTNDLARGQDPVPHLRRIADQIDRPLVWTGIPSLGGKEAAANAEIRAICAANPRCVYVEPPTALLEDGVHFSPQGYRDWIARLRAAAQ